MKHIFLFLLSLVVFQATAQTIVDPSEFPTLSSPTMNNWAIYTREDKVNRKVLPTAIRALMLPIVRQPADITYTPAATGNPNDKGSFVKTPLGRIYFIDGLGNSIQTNFPYAAATIADNDVHAGVMCVPVGGWYRLSNSNTLGMPPGTLRQRVFGTLTPCTNTSNSISPGQTAVVGGSGVLKVNGDPDTNPYVKAQGQHYESSIAYDTLTRQIYTYNSAGALGNRWNVFQGLSVDTRLDTAYTVSDTLRLVIKDISGDSILTTINVPIPTTNYTAGYGIDITSGVISNSGVTTINGETGDVTDYVKNTDPIGSVGGDLTGLFQEPYVIGIQGVPVDITGIADGDALLYDLGTNAFVPGPVGGGGSVSEPANQLVFGTGAGINSKDSLKYLNDTLLIKQGYLKIKNTLESPKIVLDNQQPFSYTSGTQTQASYIGQFYPPVNRNVATADTAAPFYVWQTYTKYQSGQIGNSVFGMGQNLGPGNTKVLANYPATGFSLESFYQPLVGGDALSEFVMTWVPKTSSARRPIAWYGNNTTNVTDVQFQTDRLSIYNPTSLREVFNATGGQFIFKGETATGSGAYPRIFLQDQRNPAKMASLVSDTLQFTIAGPKVLGLGCNDVAGWIYLTQRFGYTRLLFGKSNSQNRVFFETEDDGSGYYKSGGAILLGGYCSLSKVANNAYGAVGSNYYLDASGVLKRAGNDVSSGWNFENGGARFWYGASGAANGSITMVNKASFDSGGNLSLGTTANPSYTLDAPTTGAIRIPSGSTGAAPTGAVGVLRVNTSTSKLQVVRASTTYEDVMTLQDAMSASSGQVLKWNGSAWAPAADGASAGTGGIYTGSGSIPSGGSTVTATNSNPLIFTSTESSGNQFRFNLTQGSGLQFNNNSGTQLSRFYSTSSAFVQESATRQQTIQGLTSVNLIASDGAKTALFTVRDSGYVTFPTFTNFPAVTGDNKTGWNSTLKKIQYMESSNVKTIANKEDDFKGLAFTIRTSNFTLGATNIYSEIVDANAGSVVVTLGVDMEEGKDFVVKCRRNGTNTVTFSAGGSHVFEVDGLSTIAPTLLVVGASGTGIEAPYKVYTIRRSGLNIFIQ